MSPDAVSSPPNPRSSFALPAWRPREKKADTPRSAEAQTGEGERTGAGLGAEDIVHLGRAIDARLRRELAEFARVLLRDADGGSVPSGPDAPGAHERRAMRAFLGDDGYAALLRRMEVLRDAVVGAPRIRIGDATLASAVRIALGRFDLRAYGQELAPREHAARIAGWAHSGTPARAAMAAYWERQANDFPLKLLASFLDPALGERRLRATFRLDP